MKTDGPLHLAEAEVGESQVSQVFPLAPSVADLAVDLQPLLVISDGPLHLAQAVVGEADRPEQPADTIRRHRPLHGLDQERLKNLEPFADPATILEPVGGRAQQLITSVVFPGLERVVAGFKTITNVA